MFAPRAEGTHHLRSKHHLAQPNITCPAGASIIEKSTAYAVLFSGGGGESRTPVRKHFHRNFSGRRRLFTFPYPGVSRHTQGLGSFMMHGALKALRAHVRHSSTPVPGPWPLRDRRPPLIRQRSRNWCCSLIYKECPFYGGQAPPPAIPVSASPSKPVRPPVVGASFGSFASTQSVKAHSLRCASSPNHKRFAGL